MQLKHCKRCGKDKPATAEHFAKVKSQSRGIRKRPGLLLASACKAYTKLYKATFYKNNKTRWEASYALRTAEQIESSRRRTAAYAARNPEAVRASQQRCYTPAKRFAKGLLDRYGITPAQYEELLAAQGGACAICRVVPNKRLHVDHDHRTGAVRGLLCSECNLGLGKFRDSVEVLQSALSYLQVSSVQSVEKAAHELRLITGGKCSA